MCCRDTLHIGQTESCEMKLPSCANYEDVEFAVILPNEAATEWRIVKTTPYYDVCVNGVPIGIVVTLHHGDRISFGGQKQELVFSIHQDEIADGLKYGVRMEPPRMNWWMPLACVALTFAVVGVVFAYSSRHEMDEDMMNEAKTSVLRITVDSVQYIRQLSPDSTKVLGTYHYSESEGSMISGTAFLTTDSLLITARHCIQPWLNDPQAIEVESPNDLHSQVTRWAMLAETYNQCVCVEDTVVFVPCESLITYCSLYRYEDGNYEREDCVMSSASFRIRTDRDNVVELGNYSESYYWRSIAARPNRRSMALGDLAVAHYHRAGCIEYINQEERLTELLDGVGRKLYFVGYPSGEQIVLDDAEDKLRSSWTPGELLMHGGDLKPGFSGGPVLTRRDASWCAIGAISVSDSRNSQKSYSVPLTEMNDNEEE